MNLVNKKVMHETFGIGSVLNYTDSVIKINFESGEKKFLFPDVFMKYITFVDENATEVISKKIEVREEEIKQEEEEIEERRALEQQRRYIANQKERSKSGIVNSKVQSVFWCESDEVEEIFTEWKVFTGEIKSGKKKGQPRRLARMNQNSACLITKRDDDMPERDRQVLGVFLANDYFDGRTCEDGYIIAHPNHRLKLSEEESQKILFWNYYASNVTSNETVWNSGRQRYFDNIWMAQILRDIVNLREKSENQKEAQEFFDYFCRINFINQKELPNADGALTRTEDKEEEA